MSLVKTRDAARGRWRGILTHFGIDGAFLKNEHGPCPLCKGKDRFRWDDHEGDGGFYCNQCGPGSGLHLLMSFRGWTFQEATREIDAMVGNVAVAERKAVAQSEDKRAAMARMFRESQPVTPGDPVWRYLESRCGAPGDVLKDIRFHPALKHSVDGGLHPAMLALMWPTAGAKAIGIHRTYLTADGRKAAVDPVRMSFGELAPVRLGMAQERMGIAEGIETAISAGKLFGVPCWAAISANGLKTWEPPESVRSVVICGDNDASFTGQDAAFSLAHRLKRQGLDVEVQIPSASGSDWADVQMEGVA